MGVFGNSNGLRRMDEVGKKKVGKKNQKFGFRKFRIRWLQLKKGTC